LKVRNDNSSRFGKYMEISFDNSKAPVGGVVSTFLLEKTRVAYQQKKERNFHIFYHMLAGLDGAKKQELGLGDASQFFYLSQSGCTTVDNVDDRVEFQEVQSAMRTIGFSDSEQGYIWLILAAILHVGNIRFQGEAPAQVSDPVPVRSAASLLGVEPDLLIMSLNHRHIQSGSARNTNFAVPQNAEQAAGIRDALAKELYARLFDYVVKKVNGAMMSGTDKVIGVLDIYGFEIFENNSFEQLCINYVNERLQQIFIDLTVRGEQAEYKEEGLKWTDIKFFDNKIVCDLLEGRQPPGIFRLLDDTCRTVHSLDSATCDGKFMEKLVKTHKQHEHFAAAAEGPTAHQFTIKHYAGNVEYSVMDFSVKNKDNLFISLVSAMQTSSHHFIAALFPEDAASKKSPTTAGFKIRESASFLVKRLSACVPHYVRCIKSNDSKSPLSFNTSRVEHQVKYLGLLENVKVKRGGYAWRNLHSVFLNRFKLLMGIDANPTLDQLIQFCQSKYSELPPDQFTVGKSKLFIKAPETIWILEDKLLQITDAEAYKERVKAFKEAEKLAGNAGKHNMRSKCSVQ
jgi:myosin I